MIAYHFQITYDELGSPVTHELKKNGQNIPVTNSSREGNFLKHLFLHSFFCCDLFK